MSKWHTEGTQGHIAGEWKSQVLNPGNLAPGCIFSASAFAAAIKAIQKELRLRTREILRGANFRYAAY